jgi:deoxyribonuclease (pyrimidine dimer)
MRCNAGIPPRVLLDQHLIAEYRELMIPLGQLRRMNFEFKTPIPDQMPLGKGHISFWRDKQVYLRRRHEALIAEMLDRGFQPAMTFWPFYDVPDRLLNDWHPSDRESDMLKERIIERYMNKPFWYKYQRKAISPEVYLEMLKNTPCGVY